MERTNSFIFSLFFGCAGSLLWCSGFSLWWLLLLKSTDFRPMGFSSCDVRAQVRQSWLKALVAVTHMGSSWTRDQTGVPCSGRQILTPGPPGKSETASILVTSFDPLTWTMLESRTSLDFPITWPNKCLYPQQFCFVLFLLSQFKLGVCAE